MATSVTVALTVASAVGCGPPERQDAGAPSGRFAVEVLSASFPTAQRLAQTSRLEIVVRNAGNRTIPELAATVQGFDTRVARSDVADPRRPVFIVNARRRSIGGEPEVQEIAPGANRTALNDTWVSGPLAPGATRRLVWSVTAVRAGRFRLRWSLAPSLYGRAVAVDRRTGRRPAGEFVVRVSDRAPQVRVADDGRTIVAR
ncbi:hypothetical protein JDY09_08210 [Thermoleophilum album]|uniref:hypothetical protein n=1 Tax=Thermoleophilum album TaxID=29539 RepID=UPI00237C9313|nr:hypothetical protein [Thermoleophilum album]WDT93364.1 hypothetical protein JDY09_08210 [Thermoleophilum album]